jgi:hypothetical protein
MISAKTKNLIQAISIEGIVDDKYFAVTSEAPRNMVEANINAMPRNGRSARAGATWRVGLFFSIAGRDARSSLAAAAGGGVTAGLRRRIIESGGGIKKRQPRDHDKAGKQEADMRKWPFSSDAKIPRN